MNSSDNPPKALIELMKNNHEVETFENFKVTSASELHPGFKRKTRYDAQRAVFKPLPSTSVDYYL